MSGQEPASSVAARLVRAREAADFTTAQLARRIGVRTRTLGSWEAGQGEPRANKLVMIAGVLGVSPTWLLMGHGQAPDDGSGEVSLLRGELAQLRRQHATMGRIIERLDAHLGDLARR